jgi:putative flavoprotein involved in K+ transport
VRGQAIERTTTVVIGAGHAGLAASHFLSDRSIDHVVLERGEVANSWRRERWDALRLLTPNWQSRLLVIMAAVSGGRPRRVCVRGQG